MGAIWMRARAELRSRRRSALALALLIGLGGGAVVASAAGARRTGTAFSRLTTETQASHAVVSAGYGSEGFTLEELSAIPEVVAARRARLYLMLTGDLERCDDGECLSVGIAQGPSVGGVLDEGKLVSGRLPDPDDPAEVALTVVGDDLSPLEVGDTFALSGVPFDEPFFTSFAGAVKAAPLQMKIVGVVALPRDFPPQLGDETIHLILTPAFLARYDVSAFGVDDAVAVRLRGDRDLGALRRHVLAADKTDVFVFDRVGHSANVSRSMHLQAVALWLLAAFAGLALVLIISQLISRELAAGADDHLALAALGMSRRALVGAAILRVVAISAAGAALSVPVAIALSASTPIGLARIAEPAPGLAFDAAAIATGIGVIILGSALVAVWPAFRAATLARTHGEPARTSFIARATARTGLAPAPSVGLRLALEPGSGRTAVPVRTTIATVVIGIGALVASLSFGASLNRLVGTPRLYGVPWDVSIESESFDLGAHADDILDIGGVEELSTGLGFDVTMLVGDEEVETVVLDPVTGSVAPPILEGRAPSADAADLEAALGTATMRRLSVELGDRLAFTLPEVGEFTATVVGRGVIPTESDVSAIGDAAWLSAEALLRAAGVAPGSPEAKLSRIYLRLAPGTEAKSVVAALRARFELPEDDIYLPPVGTPQDLVSFGRVRNLPLVVAGLLGLIAAGALAHSLITAIRRRRRDMAILKTLGFSSGQARAAIAVQASVVTLTAAIIGIPVGIVAGRWAWAAFARGQGVIVESAIPTAAIAIALPVALVLANLIAALPGRAAARTRPAIVLRAE